MKQPVLRHRRKGLSAMAFILIAVLMAFLLGGCFKKGGDQKQIYDDRVEGLYAQKTERLADLNKAGEMLDLLPFLEGLTRENVLLQQDALPYSLEVTYAYDGISVNSAALYYQACLLFCLVGNLERAEFVVDGERYGWSREEISRSFGREIGEMAADLEEFRSFYAQLQQLYLVHQYDDHLYYYIPDDRQIVRTSGTLYQGVFDETVKLEQYDLKALAEQQGVDLSPYYGKQFGVLFCDVERIASGEGQDDRLPYAFLIYDGNVMYARDLQHEKNKQKMLDLMKQAVPNLEEVRH